MAEDAPAVPLSALSALALSSPLPGGDANAAQSLPADVVALVLRRLWGRVRLVSAAACVSKAWHEAAARPAVLPVINASNRAVAARLDGARLAVLVTSDHRMSRMS